MRWLVRSCVLSCACLLAACGGAGSTTGRRAVPPAEIVAEVSGAAISVADVAAYVRQAGIDRRAALDELVTLEVLAQEATRKGLDPQGAELDDARRAAVRVLLHRDFEASRRKQDIPRPLLEETYRQRKVYFVHPPIRRVHNVLASEKPPVPGSQAFGRVRDFVAEARRDHLTGDAFRQRAEARGLHVDPNLSTFEGDPRFAADWVSVVTRGAFAAGSISDPFPTQQFGWHSVLFIEESPARNTTLEEALPEIRDRILDDYRTREFTGWLAALLGRHQVVARPELLAELEKTPPRTP